VNDSGITDETKKPSQSNEVSSSDTTNGETQQPCQSKKLNDLDLTDEEIKKPTLMSKLKVNHYIPKYIGEKRERVAETVAEEIDTELTAKKKARLEDVSNQSAMEEGPAKSKFVFQAFPVES
jgi:hypothetical protein